jgi:hypothetical protein
MQKTIPFVKFKINATGGSRPISLWVVAMSVETYSVLWPLLAAAACPAKF